MRILLADKLDPRCFEVLDGTGVEVVDRAGISMEDLADEIAAFDALVVRSRTKVTDELLGRASALRVVGRAGTGVDNIDVAAATRRGVIVMNTPGANSNSAAEHTIALMTGLCRNIGPAYASLREGAFERSRFTGVELQGKTLGVVGLGRIGCLVAQKAQGLGLAVIGHDPVTTAAVAAQHGVDLRTLDDILGEADIVSLHLPLTAETHHIVDRESLARMKPGVRLINCARGGLIDEDALLEAIESGRVAGAALDVFEQEPPGGSPLLARPEVLATPHLGASTVEAQETVSRNILVQVADHLLGRGTRGALNGLSLDDATRGVIGPYLNLAERMGRILAALHRGGDRLTARYYGPVTNVNVRPLTSYLLKGFLGRFLDEEVNELNAWDLAKHRGMTIDEVTRDEHRSFHSLLYFKLGGAGGKHSLAGTVFGKSNLRIVRIGGYNLDAIPEGWMLIVFNHDRPGILGSTTTALGEAGVNIGNMSLGRDAESGQACAVLNLDSEPPASALERIGELDGVIEVQLVDAEPRGKTT